MGGAWHPKKLSATCTWKTYMSGWITKRWGPTRQFCMAGISLNGSLVHQPWDFRALPCPALWMVGIENPTLLVRATSACENYILYGWATGLVDHCITFSLNHWWFSVITLLLISSYICYLDLCFFSSGSLRGNYDQFSTPVRSLRKSSLSSASRMHNSQQKSSVISKTSSIEGEPSKHSKRNRVGSQTPSEEPMRSMDRSTRDSGLEGWSSISSLGHSDINDSQGRKSKKKCKVEEWVHALLHDNTTKIWSISWSIKVSSLRNLGPV